MAEILSPEKVADALGVHVVTVRRWLREGALPGRKVGRRWFVLREDMEAFLKGGDSFGEKGEDRASAGSSSHAAAEDSQARFAGSSSGPLKVRIIG